MGGGNNVFVRFNTGLFLWLSYYLSVSRHIHTLLAISRLGAGILRLYALADVCGISATPAVVAAAKGA